MVNIVGLASDAWVTAVAQCPKHMMHGPCAGVGADGTCEVPGVGKCSYLSVPEHDWPYTSALPACCTADRGGTSQNAATRGFLAKSEVRPIVVADLVAPALSADGLRACAAEFAGAVDACLTGDHGAARVQFPPSYLARLLADAGVPAWVGVNCRDRNRVALEGEIAACLDAGAVALHCVTGDHPDLGHRPDARAVFDFDSIDLLKLARSYGGLCSVAHAPAAVPVEHRLARVLAKISAGADVVFVDHCGGVDRATAAVAGLRATGFDGLILMCVPVVTSNGAAKILASFAGDQMPPGYLEAILGAEDPLLAGVTAAVDLVGSMLKIPGVNGVNLSAGAPPGYEFGTAKALAEISYRVQDGYAGMHDV